MTLVDLALILVIIVMFLQRKQDKESLALIHARLAILEGTMAVAETPPRFEPNPALAPTPAPAPIPMPQAVATPAPAQQFEGPVIPAGPRERSNLERVIAEHTLALVGGIFVLIAAVLFVTFAIDQGWLSETARFVCALIFATGMLVAAVRVAARLPESERAGRAIGSLHGVLAGTGIGVASLAIVAAVRVQEILDPSVGVVLTVVVAVVAVGFAHRWRSQDLAAFGMGVALASPILVDAPATGSTVLLLSAALVGTVVVAVAEHWPRMLLAAALITAPQLVSYMDTATATATATAGDAGAGDVTLQVTVWAWWLLLLAGSVAVTLRSERGASSSVLSTVFVAAAVGAGSFAAYAESEATSTGTRAALLLVFAAANILVGAVSFLDKDRRARTDVLAMALICAGSIIALQGFADALDDGAVTAAWMAEAVLTASVFWRARSALVLVAALLATCAALVHLFVVSAPPMLLWESTYALDNAALALGTTIVLALGARWLQPRMAGRYERSERVSPTADQLGADRVTREMLELLAALAAWYLPAILIARSTDIATAMTDPGALLLGGWILVAALCAAFARSRWERSDALLVGVLAMVVGDIVIITGVRDPATSLAVLAPLATVSLLVLAWAAGARPVVWIVHATWSATLLSFVALLAVPPDNLHVFHTQSLLGGLAGIAVALAGAAALGFVLDHTGHARHQQGRQLIIGIRVLIALLSGYAVSISVVGSLSDSHAIVVDQQAQLALTVSWGVMALIALFAGTSARLRHLRPLRIGAYTLLGVAAVKVVTFDTAELEPPMRVLTFLLTGMALLGGAALEQRMRRIEQP